MKILIAYDGSQCADDALDEAEDADQATPLAAALEAVPTQGAPR